MHRDLKALLTDAKGHSTKVVAIFVDVRGFTSWRAESTDAADYLQSVYTRMLSDHVKDCDYFKLTGDGMLVIYEFEKSDLNPTLRKTVKKSLALVKAFPRLTEKDRLINFDVPTRLAIGLARGSATVITSGGKTLDYTGRTLNLAARLMDIARPAGVVLEGGFGLDLLAPTTQKLFAKDAVYINGIAEETPFDIYYQRNVVEIPEHRKLPITTPVDFLEPAEKVNFKTISERSGRYRHPLSHEPAKKDSVVMHVRFPKPMSNGRKHPSEMRTPIFNAKLVKSLTRWHAEVDYVAVTKVLAEQGCKPGWPVVMVLEYPIRAQPVS